MSTPTSTTPFTPIQPATNSAKSRSRLPMVSGIARRIGRAVKPVEKDTPRKAPEKLTISSPRPIASPSRSPPASKSSSLPALTIPARPAAQKSAVEASPAPSSIKRLSSGASPRSSAIASPSRQKQSSAPIPTRLGSIPRKSASTRPEQSLVKTPVARQGSKSEISPTGSSLSQDAKPSAGRNFLRRISNIPGSTSKSKPESQPSNLKPTTANKPRSNTVGSPLPLTLSTPSPQALADPTGRALIASRLENLNAVASTKPRSNTVNSFSITRKSPLSQSTRNGSSSGSDLEFNSPSKSTGSQLPIPKRVGKPVSLGISSPRPSLVSPTASKFSGSAGRPTSTSKTPPVPVQRSSNTPPDSATPSSPSEHAASFTSKANKRMTNSTKPLIPTWSESEAPTPAQCRDLFRNSLSMVVR
ncbi:hypothetical protein CPB83DRAFT_401512 [Crepidotus variabilis]|uniref:Uncharacterized protein n=1 Tax=Crepidotus variabilis TaxID=179855 RepID=A0A9P6EDZ7_9AGAR|nr:hypothetical protein CPB83DRAFT_401512 [Crepidotus variabilis]